MKTIRLRVPGKILLSGEYAVLEGYPALCMAIDRYLYVNLSQRSSGGWTLRSNLWSEARSLATASPAEIAAEPLLQVAAYLAQHTELQHADCSVESELDIRHGFGSSTAVRLAVLLAADILREERTSLSVEDRLRAAKLSYQMQVEQQGFASGYDALIQAVGGLKLWTPDYQDWPGKALQTPPSRWLSGHIQVFVGGCGAPTRTVGQSLRQALLGTSSKADFLRASEQVLGAWLGVLENGPQLLPELCQALRQQRAFFAKLDYFPSALFSGLESLEGFDQNFTLKTTGAGGEDALLLIGLCSETSQARSYLEHAGWQQLPLHLDVRGALIDAEIKP